jgi:hypothetical protein
MARPDTLGVVVIGNTPELDPELRMLTNANTRVAVLASSGAAEMGTWAREHDPTRLLLERLQDDLSARGPTPYEAVAEALLESWLEQQS